MTKARGKPRPNAWKYTDPVERARYMPYQRAKAQAKFRGEEFLLTLEEFCQLWTDELWAKRGRGSGDLALSRKNFEGPWSVENCQIMPRREQVSQANIKRHRDKVNERKANQLNNKGLST